MTQDDRQEIESKMTSLVLAFKNLKFDKDFTAYWQLPSGYKLVIMWEEEPCGDGDWYNSYDADIRGYGDIDLTQCPLYDKYDRGSFSSMRVDDVLKLAEWIEKYADDKAKAQQ